MEGNWSKFDLEKRKSIGSVHPRQLGRLTIWALEVGMLLYSSVSFWNAWAFMLVAAVVSCTASCRWGMGSTSQLRCSAVAPPHPPLRSNQIEQRDFAAHKWPPIWLWFCWLQLKAFPRPDPFVDGIVGKHPVPLPSFVVQGRGPREQEAWDFGGASCCWAACQSGLLVGARFLKNWQQK